MKGNETKGGETVMILATMDGSRGGSKGKGKDQKKRSHGCCGRVPWLLVQRQQLPWVLWPVHFHSDHPNYVLPLSPLQFHNKL